MKSCTSSSRVEYKKIERKVVLVDKWKKKVRIIDDDGFTKVVNTQRTMSTTLRPAPKTSIPEPRIVELVSDWNKVEVAKTKALVEKTGQDR